MADPATQARVSISSSTQGSKRLRRCKSSKVSDGASTEALTALGEDEAVAFSRKPGAFTISLSIYDEQGKPEVDWRALRRTQETFSLTREVVGGGRFQYPSCRVSKIDTDDDDEGKHMLDVEIVALSERPL